MLALPDEQLARRLADHVREARSERGLSLSQLAGRSSLGKATIAAIEEGTSNATLGTVGALAVALDVQPCELLCDDGRHH